MRKRITDKITGIVSEFAKKEGYTLVLDSGSVGLNGVPIVLYTAPAIDVTEDVLKLVEKKK